MVNPIPVNDYDTSMDIAREAAVELEGKPVPERESLVHGFIPMSTVTLMGG